MFSNLSMDTLDYTGPTVNEGSKGVWLGLGRSGARAAARVRARARRRRPTSRDVRVFCGGCLVVRGRHIADDPARAARLAAHPAFAGWPLVVLTDDAARATRSEMNFLWTTFTRFEPAADIHAARPRSGAHTTSPTSRRS